MEQKSRTKRPRAPSPDPENDVDSEFDERNNDLSTNFLPPGFLSPSVLEYFELGKSIPGEAHKTFFFLWSSNIFLNVIKMAEKTSPTKQQN